VLGLYGKKLPLEHKGDDFLMQEQSNFRTEGMLTAPFHLNRLKASEIAFFDSRVSFVDIVYFYRSAIANPVLPCPS